MKIAFFILWKLYFCIDSYLSKANSSPRCSFSFRWSFWETLTVWAFEFTVAAGYWTPHFKLFCSWYFLCFPFAEKDASGAQQSKPSKSSKQAWRSLRVRPAPARQPREDGKDRRHPFALYGSGEKDADIAGRKTHNVCPAASTHEVTFLSVALWVCVVNEHKCHQELTVLFIFLVDLWVGSAC